MNTFTPPLLSTLDDTPSWHNNRGRIDRAACIELRVSEVRRLAGCVRDKPRIWPHMNKVRLPVQPLPDEQPAPNQHGRVATGTYTVTARQLHELQQYRLPRPLAGDWRTTRANAMRPHYFRCEDGFAHRKPHNAEVEDYPLDAGLLCNPNRGATRTKMIGVLETWSQQLRIEKWNFPKRIAPAYYLICPGTFPHALCSGREGSCESRLSPFDGRLSIPAPPLSTCPAGRKATGCPQRTLKLLMVQCTEAEFVDAQTAALWIDSIPSQHIPRLRPAINQLIARYGPILPPRRLLCARCLGVRYGNDPENARQSWRRAQGKPDARPAKRTIDRSNNHEWARQQKRKRNRHT